MVFLKYWTKRVNNSVVSKDIRDAGVMPSHELLSGKRMKQSGEISTGDGREKARYFLERLPNSELEIEVLDVDLNSHMIDAAIFELWLQIDGEWHLIGAGPAPLDKRMYDEETEFFF